ncbi:flagellar motor switch protein FliG [Rubinisphaera sp.]|mgnify:CR=1 FL=1|uniref:flagellar motor switch protein FliG n=1 Tax=Rubinisphaera sp. TaxID=2024857 RepID=UPI000C0DAF77|nr:flagellar motor switch protein FliG [Rubinisphaera sp.]MBV10409.1 flagellar motor switch protein FliG [Rubinisphaera sp.]HCS54113.1 flagellar motor switch protein FliG [Planctomycetaceae bacterium]|tara:strand:- start:6484 stop:7476 length:993 start_codon:yes stop_codon:yes gene_type:complete
MDAVRKSAILLLTLEKPLAREVISQMPRELVEKVTIEIAKIKNVSRAEQEKVLDEYYSAARERTPIERGGLQTVDDLLKDSFGGDGQSILENVRQSMNSVPFGFLHKVGAENVLTFIVEEHPQTIALILSHLPASQAAEVLSGLPANKQLEVIRRVAHMEQTSPEVVEDVEKSLEGRMLSTINQQLEKAGGVPIVAEILNLTDRMTNRGILENLEEEDSELADEIRRLMFVFDDLMKLDNKAIQSLLKEVDNSQWALALKGASEEIREKVLSNLSQRASEMLREEMEFLGSVRVSDVEAMQSQIVDVVRRLEDSGEIVVSAGNSSEQFIA